MRIPILKTCEVCQGSGGHSVLDFDNTNACSGTSGWTPCQKCNGHGAIETDMFVDVDPTQNFFLDDNWGAKDA